MILSCAILGNRRQNKTNSANLQSYSLINCLSKVDNYEIKGNMAVYQISIYNPYLQLSFSLF